MTLATEAKPGSLASAIQADSPVGCQIALLGLPDDAGVSMNGGRTGAKDGPQAFRNALARYGTSWYVPSNGQNKCDISEVGVFDAGDVKPEKSLEATHAAVTVRVGELREQNLLPVCIGGGHDLTWPCIRAVAERYPEIAGVYFDAHLDVREEAGSGMPFRKILSETTCSELTAVGLDPFANKLEHLDWFLANGGRVADWVGEMTQMQAFAPREYFVSFDLDAIDSAFAPGVSASNPVGLRAESADYFAWWAGHLRYTRYFDIMKLNPALDLGGRTARLAARLFLSFLAGFASRPQ